MELMQLRYFKVVAELEHISKAANELHIPQPYLSQTIRKIEFELGNQLFDRKGKHIVLNDAGKIFLKYTNQVLSSLNNATLELNSFREMETQEVTICFQSASMLIPQLMKEIIEKHPNLHFTICQRANDVEFKDIDITIYSTNKHIPEPNEYFLLKEDLMLILPITHPLSNYDQISVEDIREEKFISLSKQCNLYTIIQKYYEQMEFVPKTSFYIDNPSIMREMIINGFGISIIPAITWNNMTQKDMVLKSIQFHKMERYVYLAWNPQKYRSKVVNSCIDQITEYFTSLYKGYEGNCI